jgi:hypothetical protein
VILTLAQDVTHTISPFGFASVDSTEWLQRGWLEITHRIVSLRFLVVVNWPITDLIGSLIDSTHVQGERILTYNGFMLNLEI